MTSGTIKLANFFQWRMIRLILFILFMFLAYICSLIIIKYVSNQLLISLIWLLAFVLYGVVEKSKCFKRIKTWNYSVSDEVFELNAVNEKKVYYLSNIANLRYEERRYGGKWLDVIGYLIVFEYNNSIVKLQAYSDGLDWEKTEISNLYSALKCLTYSNEK